jgi:flagellar protein FlbD
LIQLTRLNSQQITVNSDLIKFVESNPDTVITLVNGEKILVHETADQVLARVIDFRRAVLAGLLNNSSDATTMVAAGCVQPQERSMVPRSEARPEGRSRG